MTNDQIADQAMRKIAGGSEPQVRAVAIEAARLAREQIAAMADEWAAKNRAASNRSAKREQWAGIGGYEPPIMADELMACAQECEAFAAAIRAGGTAG